MRLLYKTLFIIFLFFNLQYAYSQSSDHLKLTLPQADSLFFANNFSLLAQQYQIQADEALVQQAKKWENPTFSVELGMNEASSSILGLGHGGQSTFSVEQLISTAGKRHKNIQLARLNGDMSKAAFDDLMRSLKLDLHTYFYSLYFQQQTLLVFKEQEEILKQIIEKYESANLQGSVTHADFIRLKALYLNLKNDYLNAEAEMLSLQKNLQQLLGTVQFIEPVVFNPQTIKYAIANYPLIHLIDSALVHRPDLKMSISQYESAQVNLSLQKSMKVPDLQMGMVYDKVGGYVPHYVGLQMGVQLPLWNRNKGNIKAAGFMVNQSEVEKNQKENVIKTEVIEAYNKLKNYEKSHELKEFVEFENSFKTLMSNVTDQFAKGNISLLQFIDFFNSYSDYIADFNSYFERYYIACEELEFVVGTSLNEID